MPLSPLIELAPECREEAVVIESDSRTLRGNLIIAANCDTGRARRTGQ